MQKTVNPIRPEKVKVLAETGSGEGGVVHLEHDGQALCGTVLREPVGFEDGTARVIDILCVRCGKLFI